MEILKQINIFEKLNISKLYNKQINRKFLSRLLRYIFTFCYHNCVGCWVKCDKLELLYVKIFIETVNGDTLLCHTFYLRMSFV